jgi:hypothetical protein
MRCGVCANIRRHDVHNFGSVRGVEESATTRHLPPDSMIRSRSSAALLLLLLQHGGSTAATTAGGAATAARHPHAHAQTVTPWEVEADEEIDYNKLVSSFGSQLISEDMVARVERLTGQVRFGTAVMYDCIAFARIISTRLSELRLLPCVLSTCRNKTVTQRRLRKLCVIFPSAVMLTHCDAAACAMHTDCAHRRCVIISSSSSSRCSSSRTMLRARVRTVSLPIWSATLAGATPVFSAILRP